MTGGAFERVAIYHGHTIAHAAELVLRFWPGAGTPAELRRALALGALAELVTDPCRDTAKPMPPGAASRAADLIERASAVQPRRP